MKSIGISVVALCCAVAAIKVKTFVRWHLLGSVWVLLFFR